MKYFVDRPAQIVSAAFLKPLLNLFDDRFRRRDHCSQLFQTQVLACSLISAFDDEK
jgi:hypothetical protein